MALSTEQKAGRLAAYDGFQAKIVRALITAAADVKGEEPIYAAPGSPVGPNRVSTYSAKRASLAASILTDPRALAGRVAQLVAAQPGISSLLEPVDVEDDASTGPALDAAVSYNDVAFTVASLYNDLAGIDAWDDSTGPTGAALVAARVTDPAFQARVYQIGAELANSILVAAPLPSDATAEQKAVDAVKRLFALKYQAGRYSSAEHRFNYATNVLADPTLAAKAPADITDAEIQARLAQLVGIFAASMAAFKAAGVDTGLLV